MMPTEYALSGETQRREMDVINQAWALLSPLDTAARYRVLEWLSSWARHEAPKGESFPDHGF